MKEEGKHVETHKAKYCRKERLREQNIEPLTCEEVVDMWSSTNSDFNVFKESTD